MNGTNAPAGYGLGIIFGDPVFYFRQANFGIPRKLNMKNAPNEAHLDRDALNGHGPETITASSIKADAVYDLGA